MSIISEIIENKKNTPLTWKFLAYILLFSSVFTIFITSFQLYIDYERDLGRIDDQMKLIENSYLIPLVGYVWNVEKSQTEILLSNIINLPDIQYVELVDVTTELNLNFGKKTKKRSITHQLDLDYAISDSKTAHLGELYIIATLDNVYSHLRERIVVILATQTIKTFFVSLFIFFISYYLVTRHLIAISRYATSMDLERLDHSLELNRKTPKNTYEDELDQVVSSINCMRSRILCDIAEQKKAEKELAEREEKYRAVVENTGDYIMRYDKKCRHIYANKKALEASGLLNEQYIGKTHREMGFPEQLCELLEKNIESVFNTGLQKNIEFDVELADRIMTLDLQLNPEFSDDGNVETVIGISRDISDRKRIEEKLRDSILNLDEAVRAGRVGLWNWDLETNKVTYSTEWKRQIGYEDHEIQNEFHEWETRVHPDDFRSASEVIQKSIKEINQDHRIEFRFRHKNGSYRWILAQASFILDEEGHPIKMLGSHIDITEQKKLEVQLHQAQKMEAIGTLAGGIAHDFNNILAAILGYAEMARDDSPPESTVAKDLDKVLEGCRRAKDLVQQILAFSRQSEIEKIPLQPVNVVKETIKMLRPSLPATIKIKLDIPSATRLILADPTQIHQILLNLCTNAFHAMEETGGKLDISLKEATLSAEDLVYEPDVEAGTFVKLSVCDSGFGMPEEIKKKVFEPYFTTKETDKGTGMGLAIVHGIVKSYGGFISLYSEPGKGTAFHVFFPVIEKEQLNEIEDVEPIPIGRERILFIDDEEMLAELGKSMLERLGYHVTVRNNSIEALKTFQNQPDLFDLVITDQTMPGMTGADIARRMLQIRPDIPIILCTGYSTLISEERAKSLGIKEFALKPLSLKDIAVLIRKVLGSS